MAAAKASGVATVNAMKAMPSDDAVRLLVLAEQFAYPRFTVTMDPSHTEAEAERAAPGLTASYRAELDGRRGPALLPEAREVVARVTQR